MEDRIQPGDFRRIHDYECVCQDGWPKRDVLIRGRELSRAERRSVKPSLPPGTRELDLTIPRHSPECQAAQATYGIA